MLQLHYYCFHPADLATRAFSNMNLPTLYF